MSNGESKTAIVTGASRGIGAAIAERLARDGFAVIVNYMSSAGPAEELVRKIADSGGRAMAFKADVSEPAAVKAMFEAAESQFGGVDVLVNNAGILMQSDIAKATDEDFDKIVAINLKGTFNPLREGANRIRNGGRIINFSTSLVGSLLPTYGIYAATKAAVETMTSILAKELRGRSITVNAVAPGPTATDMFLAGKPAELVQQFSKVPPLERLGTPEDIAGAVSFLAGPDGGWINGQTIRANGGYV
jgi:3-oxoacyl-[acyl-carrier protein] reductase